MRIGIFVSGIGVRPGFENTFSGHTQVAIQTAKLLHDEGHDVHLLVTLQHEGLVLPGTIPVGVDVHVLTDGRWRGKVGREFRQSGGYRPFAIARQIKQIRSLIQTLRLDVLHLFGFERTAALAGVLKFTGLKCPTITTVYDRPHSRRWSWLTKFCDRVIASTRNVQQHWEMAGHAATLLRHGTIRDLVSELDERPLNAQHRQSVLFWRVLAPETGGDICLKVFDRLAPVFPDINFDLALRPSVHEMPGAEELASTHPNVRLFRFPYPEGVSLAKLVTNSLCAIFPFRRLTIEPQMAIVETLAAGTACLGSNYASISELIDSGRTGVIVDRDDADEWCRCLHGLLSDRQQLETMCKNAAIEFPATWNWDDYIPALTQVYESVLSARGQYRAAS
jgi:glycosyltransferase involved in cell wall biosynthesis